MVNTNDSIGMLRTGIKVATLRQSLLANNIANIDTPGYRRSDIDFQSVLAEALKTGKADPADLERAVMQPETTPVSADGNDVNIDAEVGEMMKNDSTLKTYMRLMAKIYHQTDMAVRTDV